MQQPERQPVAKKATPTCSPSKFLAMEHLRGNSEEEQEEKLEVCSEVWGGHAGHPAKTKSGSNPILRSLSELERGTEQPETNAISSLPITFLLALSSFQSRHHQPQN